MATTIKLIDNGSDRYILKSDSNVLGRRYDNDSESIIVEKPSAEVGSLCEMFVTYNGSLVDVIQVDDKPISVTSNLSQYPAVKIGFSFSRADGYVKNSEPKMFTFLDAIKPEDFTPSEPEGQRKINEIIDKGFVDVKWAKIGRNTLEFLDVDGNVSKTIELSGFVQEQSDLAETDNQKETFIRNKSTKYLTNDGEDGSSPYATENFVKRNGGKIDSISVNGTPQKIDESKNVDIVVPTKVADLEDAGDYAKSSQVSDLSEKVNSVETTANNAKAIAEGKATGFVFDTYDDMIAWVGTHSDVLRLGDNLYIRAVNVPDYWWDGTSVQQLETQKVDLTNYVQRTDYATNNIAGVVKVNINDGLLVKNDGSLIMMTANQTDIKQRTSNAHAITPKNLDYSIKVGLTTNTETLTEEEKANAKTWLGVPQFSVTQLDDGSYSLSINTGV